MIYVYFFYGLAFFTLGTSTLFYPKTNSRIELAKTLTFIALFGIFHGVNEWIDMFKFMQKQTEILSLNIIGLIILAVSYLFLLWFGTESLAQLNKKYSALKRLPIVLFITWAIVTTLSTPDFLLGNIWARYLLGVPGTFLSAYALILYVPYFMKNVPLITVDLRISAGAFIFYGIFSGIVVPEGGFFPASFMNDTVFLNNVGIPIQVFRALCAIVLVFSMLSILRIFNWETKELHKEISKRKELERDRKKLVVELEQKNKELEQVLQVTSHDLRSPLVNVAGYSNEFANAINEIRELIDSNDLSREKNERVNQLYEEMPQALTYIRSSVKKMDSLISGISTVSRLGRVEIRQERLDMNKLISDVQNTLKFQIEDKGVRMEVSKLPSCIGDDAQINQLFSNLIENAIKYLAPERKGIISVSGHNDNGTSVYCVEDNGIGIASHNREKIFEIFQQLEPNTNKGEGLGLSIAHKIVDRNNGKIWVESELGKGSKFFVSIPS